MIDRNALNKELLGRIHGTYVDYILLKKHTTVCIMRYLEKNFPVDEDTVFPCSIVRLNDFEYNEKSDVFSVVLTSEKLLNHKEIDCFCSEFDLKLVKIGKICKGFNTNIFRKEYYENYDDVYFEYYFERREQI